MLCRWFLLPLAIAPLAAQTGPERASIEGQVVNSRTGAPLAGAQVKLLGSDSARTQAAADRKGHFAVSGLEAGQYHIEAERAGFVPLPWSKTVITLAAGEQIQDFTIRLTPQAVVSGALLDADGAPVPNVFVSVLRHTWRGGKRTIVTAGGAQTNDAGEFRIAGLAAGSYLLRAHPRELAVPPGEDKVKRVYVPTWYPGVTDSGAASALHLTAGEERTAIAFTLRTSTVVKIRGRIVRPPPETEMRAALVMLMPADDSGEMDMLGVAQANGPEGAFAIPDVPPGAYRIRAQLIELTAGRQASGNMTAVQTIEVGDTDLAGILLSPAPPQRLAGLLKWQDQPPRGAGACVVTLGDDSRIQASNVPPATTQADGTFSLDVADSHFDLDVHCEAQGAYMKAASLGDVDVLETGIDGAAALPAGPLQITMATGAGEIAGSVLDAESHPARGATVVVVADESKRAARFRQGVTDQNGHFKFTDLVPGAYSLYAWDQIEDGVWSNEEFLKKYDSQRTRVKLNAGGREAVQLPLLKVE